MAQASAAPALPRPELRIAVVALVATVVACIAIAAIQAPGVHVGSLSVLLLGAALLAGLMVEPAYGGASISPSFIVALLAAAFLGPTSAAVAAAAAELAAARRLHTSRFAVLCNLAAALVSSLAAANLIRGLRPGASHTVTYCLAVLAGAALYLALSYAIVAPMQQLYRGDAAWSLHALREYAPSLVLNVMLTVAGAGIYLKIGIVGIAFALAAVFAFAYMTHLLTQSRNRAQQYVSLSWGVLAGLMRSLDIRDGRAARHAAAVARFSRDIAQAAGMDRKSVELAHTAGLLHDIGHFALSDRVAERGKTLTAEDWTAIQRHPELGADMLRDLGMYGPVAEIVLSHHERIDGRGYPRSLVAQEIPEIAKIISVSEVYDTLTASATYRSPMSSFEALQELRRVAGTQLDERYVELLATLLSGEGVPYRHADGADFDVELAMERRLREAADPSLRPIASGDLGTQAG